jgi:hypothetical protein
VCAVCFTEKISWFVFTCKFENARRLHSSVFILKLCFVDVEISLEFLYFFHALGPNHECIVCVLHQLVGFDRAVLGAGCSKCLK